MLLKRFYQPAREYRDLLKRVAQSMKADEVVEISDGNAPVELYRVPTHTNALPPTGKNVADPLQDVKTEVLR